MAVLYHANKLMLLFKNKFKLKKTYPFDELLRPVVSAVPKAFGIIPACPESFRRIPDLPAGRQARFACGNDTE